MATKTPPKKKARVKKISSASAKHTAGKNASRTSISANTKPARSTQKKNPKTASGKSTQLKTTGAALKKLAHATRTRAHRASKKKVAGDQECFWVNNGPVLRDLSELARAMHEISDDQFWYHVRTDQNDFARWVEEVFGERALARKIERTKSRTGTYRVLVAHVSLNKLS